MSATFIGVRHHSPACARLVASTIAALRPAYVLVEGPVEMNDRLDELLLAHRLPIAVFTSYRDDERRHASWTPLCEYSPEWVALTAGRAAGASVRFIDLPAWHPAFAERRNRYADAELRYADVMDRLCRAFAVDNVDTLWDHLFEVGPDDGIGERLAAYFDLVRGESAATESDTEREAYMAGWVRAAVADAGDRPVVVVTGGFHRPALVSAAALPGPADWPAVPAMPGGAQGGSFLVPYSFKRLDSFDGYQSGMPSPGYYQRLWDGGTADAADGLVESVVGRLRRRNQPVSTADLIAARAMAGGLAKLRGHPYPARTDVLDGLVSTLVSDALDVPVPWSTRSQLRVGTDPVIVEMIAALSGDRVGRLHPDTPLPPLVHDATAELERHALAGSGPVDLRLTDEHDLARSRTLHRLRVLGIAGFERTSGPSANADATLDEHWVLAPHEDRLSQLIEAGGYGATLVDAGTAALEARFAAGGGDVGALAVTLFDAALCGVSDLSDRVITEIERAVAGAADLGPLGKALGVVLGLWRHDRLLGTARSASLGAVISASVNRALWLAEGIRGGPSPADLDRLAAVAAVRDAVVHAGPALGIDQSAALAVMRRLSGDASVPPDLRGAAFGFGWALGDVGDLDHVVPAIRGVAAPQTLGDWLAGLFALAREEVMSQQEVLAVLDDLLAAMLERDFLVALPALRQAFVYFPPRERETIAQRLLERRGMTGSGRALLRIATPVEVLAAARDLEAHVDTLLVREGLVHVPEEKT